MMNLDKIDSKRIKDVVDRNLKLVEEGKALDTPLILIHAALRCRLYNHSEENKARLKICKKRWAAANKERVNGLNWLYRQRKKRGVKVE